jgi:hypothetical protein
VALTAVGLLQMAGTLVGSRFLLALGSLSGASPLPRVFSHQQGIETFARRARIEVRTRDGATHAIAVDRGFGRAVAGPTVRGAEYAHAALYAGLPGSARRERVLERAFCAPGEVARELGVEAPVASLRVHGWSALANDEPPVTVEIRCEP